MVTGTSSETETEMVKYDRLMKMDFNFDIDKLQTEQDFADAIRACLIPVCKIIDAARTKGFHPAFQLGPNESGKESVRTLSITKQY